MQPEDRIVWRGHRSHRATHVAMDQVVKTTLQLSAIGTSVVVPRRGVVRGYPLNGVYLSGRRQRGCSHISPEISLQEHWISRAVRYIDGPVVRSVIGKRTVHHFLA